MNTLAKGINYICLLCDNPTPAKGICQPCNTSWDTFWLTIKNKIYNNKQQEESLIKNDQQFIDAIVEAAKFEILLRKENTMTNLNRRNKSFKARIEMYFVSEKYGKVTYDFIPYQESFCLDQDQQLVILKRILRIITHGEKMNIPNSYNYLSVHPKFDLVQLVYIWHGNFFAKMSQLSQCEHNPCGFPYRKNSNTNSPDQQPALCNSMGNNSYQPAGMIMSSITSHNNNNHSDTADVLNTSLHDHLGTIFDNVLIPHRLSSHQINFKANVVECVELMRTLEVKWDAVFDKSEFNLNIGTEAFNDYLTKFIFFNLNQFQTMHRRVSCRRDLLFTPHKRLHWIIDIMDVLNCLNYSIQPISFSVDMVMSKILGKQVNPENEMMSAVNNSNNNKKEKQIDTLVNLLCDMNQPFTKWRLSQIYQLMWALHCIFTYDIISKRFYFSKISYFSINDIQTQLTFTYGQTESDRMINKIYEITSSIDRMNPFEKHLTVIFCTYLISLCSLGFLNLNQRDSFDLNSSRLGSFAINESNETRKCFNIDLRLKPIYEIFFQKMGVYEISLKIFLLLLDAVEIGMFSVSGNHGKF